MTKFEELQGLILNAKKNQDTILLMFIKNAVSNNEITNNELVLLLEDLIFYRRFLNK
jgi:hypothetical protein